MKKHIPEWANEIYFQIIEKEGDILCKIFENKKGTCKKCQIEELCKIYHRGDVDGIIGQIVAERIIEKETK